MLSFSSDIDVLVIYTNCSDEYIHSLHENCSREIKKDYLSIAETFKHIVDSKDYAILEHVIFTFKIEAPVSAFRSLMRERVVSYYEAPGVDRVFSGKFYLPDSLHGSERELIVSSISDSYNNYREAINSGMKPELARLLLPISTYADMLVTMNLKELLSFIVNCGDRSDSVGIISNNMKDGCFLCSPLLCTALFGS